MEVAAESGNKIGMNFKIGLLCEDADAGGISVRFSAAGGKSERYRISGFRKHDK